MSKTTRLLTYIMLCTSVILNVSNNVRTQRTKSLPQHYLIRECECLPRLAAASFMFILELTSQ